MNLILDGGVPLGLDLDQRQPELVGTVFVTGQLVLISAQGCGPFTDQAGIVGLQGTILGGEHLACKLPVAGHIELAGCQHAVNRVLIEAGGLCQLGLDGRSRAFALHLLQRIELAQESDVGLHAAIGRLPAGCKAAVPADGLIR